MNVLSNLAAGELSFKIDKINQNLYFQLLDINGKSFSYIEKINENETIINLKNLNEGIY